VVPFPSGQGKWQVSTNEGLNPRWSEDGKELYYFAIANRSVSSVPVKEINGALQFGAAQVLATSPASQQGFFDVSPDGKRIPLELVSQQVNQSVTVIANFGAELKK
jgi:Tol biopolymer transport system component